MRMAPKTTFIAFLNVAAIFYCIAFDLQVSNLLGLNKFDGRKRPVLSVADSNRYIDS